MTIEAKYTGWIEWEFYPRSVVMPDHMISLIDAFKTNEREITTIKTQNLVSNDILKIISSSLVKSDFIVESGKRSKEKIKRPVLFGRNGMIEKHFEVDAYSEKTRTALEVEAGRAVTNYQFLKDFFEACVMIDVDYLAIAIRKRYRNQKDFETVIKFFDALYASRRFVTPLKGILIIGY